MKKTLKLLETASGASSFTKEIRNISKDFAYNYEYKYYFGNENRMEIDEELQKKLGTGRKGYDIYRQNDSSIKVSISGVTSLRTVTQNDEIIGYITERQLSGSPKRDKTEAIYKKYIAALIEELNVQDLETFDYYINSNILTLDSVNGYDSMYTMACERLDEFVDDYKYDEEFKKFIDKIVKG